MDIVHFFLVDISQGPGPSSISNEQATPSSWYLSQKGKDNMNFIISKNNCTF